MPSGSKVANGTIVPFSFVKLDTTADGKVLQCGAGDNPYGIAQPWTRQPPYAGLDDGNAALVGETLCIYTPPMKEVMLQLGATSGTVTAGIRLKADSAGLGVPVTTDADYFGAISDGTGAAGDIIPVILVYGQAAA
jgi:hypothetical protein